MRPSDFDWVRQMVRDRSAIVLEERKRYLVESRLTPIARDAGFMSLQEMLTAVRAGGHRDLVDRMVDAMTTNETSFFRDEAPWQALREAVLPDLIERRKERRRLRIWSAACSTGQEPYTLSMMLHDHFPSVLDWDLEILATDISPSVLERARAGVFQMVEMDRGVRTPLRTRWFRRLPDGRFAIDDRAKAPITFRRMNLAARWPPFSPFDLILVRNVLIYFDSATKRGILQRMEGALAADGYLLLGSGETTLDLGVGLRRERAGRAWFYQHGGS